MTIRRCTAVLPLGCDCAPPGHGRGISRCLWNGLDTTLGFCHCGCECVVVLQAGQLHVEVKPWPATEPSV